MRALSGATSMDVSLKMRKKRGRNPPEKTTGIKRMKNEVDHGIDYISDLPEPVLHHILSFLHPKDAARMCTLSKKWKQAWNSSQVLDVDLRRFSKMNKATRERYMNQIDNLLMSRREQSLSIHKFRLRFSIISELMTRVRSWVKAAVERNVREFEIQAKPSKGFVTYLLDPCVMNGSLITALNICGCMSSTSLGIHLPRLQKLSLKKINLPTIMLQKLISRCPLINDFRLVQCSGLKKLTICTLDKLKRVDVHKCHGLKSVVIEAPKLETFWFYHNKKKLCKINLSACRALAQLVLEYPRMTDEMLQNQLLEFPSLEKLVLSRCHGLNSIRLFGDNFRDLVIRRCQKLVQVAVDAPNLMSLEYWGQRMPFAFLAPPLSLKEVVLSFERSLELDGGNACRLHSFYEYIDPYKGLKLMTHNKLDVIIYEDMRAMIPHLRCKSMPDAIKISASFVKLLDGALRTSPYPSKISLMSHRSSDFPEIIYDELKKGKTEPKCCGCFKNKCWRHYLNNISVENWIFESSDWSDASACLQWKKTTFSLDWKAGKQGRIKVEKINCR